MRSLLLASVVLTGCALDTPREDGVALDTNAVDQLVGTLTREATTIAFDFARRGTERHLTITTAEGEPLVDTVMQPDGSHVTQVLGGALVVRSTNGETVLEGDATATSRIDAIPEGKLLPFLEPALASLEIEQSLLPVEIAQPLENAPSANVDLPCGSVLWPGDYARCGTVFFGWSAIYLVNWNYYYNQASFWPGGGYWETHLLGGYYTGLSNVLDRSGWWWGKTLTATHPGMCPAPYCGSYNVWNKYASMYFGHTTSP